MASNSKFLFIYNHLLAEFNILKKSAKYKVFIFLLFITYPNYTKFGDKKVLPRLMGFKAEKAYPPCTQAVTKRDEGAYECQISTPAKMSHFVHLRVVEPRVEIEGGPDIFTQMGSRVQLRCTVTMANHVDFVLW